MLCSIPRGRHDSIESAGCEAFRSPGWLPGARCASRPADSMESPYGPALSGRSCASRRFVRPPACLHRHNTHLRPDRAGDAHAQ